MQRSAAERSCVNFVIQGSAADIMCVLWNRGFILKRDRKLAMIQVFAALRANPHLRAHPVLQIHDEIILGLSDMIATSYWSPILETHKDDIEPVKELVKNMMVTVIDLRVPLAVSASVGPRWGQLIDEKKKVIDKDAADTAVVSSYFSTQDFEDSAE